DAGELQRRGIRVAAARLPVRRALRPRPDLPRRRPRRPGHPDLAAADRGQGRVRRDDGHPRRRPQRGVVETAQLIPFWIDEAGLRTALAMRSRDPDLDVVLIEADFCGSGPSGRNGGFLHGWWSALGRLRPLFGDAGALELARIGDRVIPGVRAFLEARSEDAWL